MGNPVEFRVLGPLEVIAAGESIRLGGPRPRALLGVLLVHAGQVVSTDRLVDQLWGDDPPATAIAALQVHVSALRKVLGERLVTAAAGYLLEAGDDEVDAVRFEGTVAAARRHLGERPARAAADLAGAMGLWRGEPYGGVPAGSDVLAARQRLAELRLSAVEDRMDAELTLGRHAQVVSELAGLVVDHPIRERLVGLYLLALYRCGRSADAQASYRALAKTLYADLGVEPGAEVAALARAIDRGDPTLNPPSTIPIPPSRFIGRRHELEQLADGLGEARLLTVTGPGGAGKTRLALELARDTATDHRDGVHVVELATSPAGSSVADRVASALGVRARGDEPLEATLTTRLRNSRALIVLDNCEHLVDGCAALAAELLSTCAGLRIVATSREPLGVAGERVWPLAGLTVPTDGDTPAVAARTEAVRLLADRGAGARPEFAVDAGNIVVAGRLCRRLDGLPLAIELAAAQLRTLSLEEVAERLGRRLDLADRRSRTTPDRHRTMRAAIDWSYHLLAPRERTLFRRLAVFAGGCRPDDAELVVGEAHDLLARLVDQSVLTAEPSADGTRYRMLELVREYATERFAESGEAAEIRRRHTLWCAGLAESAAQSGPDHAAWLRRLAAEVPNLRAAVEWCLGDGADTECALRIAVPLWWYWWSHGMLAEGRDWLRRAMAAADRVPPVLHARSMRAAASLARHGLDHAEARALGEQSLAAYQALGDLSAVSGALSGLCYTAVAQRDFTAAVRFAEDACRVAEQAGDELQLAAATNNLAVSLLELDRLAEATAAFGEARQRFRAVKESRGEADVLNGLAMAARRAGELTRSRELALTGLVICRDTGLVVDQLKLIGRVAAVELAEGRPEVALRLLAVTARERDRLAAPQVIPAEIADEGSTWAGAAAALGPRAEAITESARDLPLATVVDGLLDT